MQPLTFPSTRDSGDAYEQLVHVVTSPVEGSTVMALVVGQQDGTSSTNANAASITSSNGAEDAVGIAAAYVGQHDRKGNRHGVGVLAIRPPLSVAPPPPPNPVDGQQLPAMPSGLMPSDATTPSAAAMAAGGGDNFNSRAERGRAIRAGGDTAFLCQWDRDLALLSPADMNTNNNSTANSSAVKETTLPVVLVQGGMRSKVTAAGSPFTSPTAADDEDAPSSEARAFVPTSLYVGEASLLSGGPTSRAKLQGLEWAHKRLRVLPHGVGMASVTNVEGVTVKGGEEGAGSKGGGRGGKLGNRKMMGSYRASMAAASGDAPCFVGEFELGERTGFGAEMDFTNGPTHKPGGGGGITAETLISGSNPEAALSGEMGASSDCTNCMNSRSAPPLCDLSLPRRVMPSYEQHPIGYIGPYHTDAREGSGMLYRYGGAGSYGQAPPPPILIAGLWKDGQMVTQPVVPSARQLTHNIDVTLLKTSHKLCGHGWTFDNKSIGFEGITMTCPKGGGSQQRHTDGIWEALLGPLDQHLSNTTMGLGDEDDDCHHHHGPTSSVQHSAPLVADMPPTAPSSVGSSTAAHHHHDAASNDHELTSPPSNGGRAAGSPSNNQHHNQQQQQRIVESFAVVTPRSRLWRALAKAIRKEAFITLLTTFQQLYYKLHTGQHEVPHGEAALTDPFVRATRGIPPPPPIPTTHHDLAVDDDAVHRAAVSLTAIGALVPRVEAEVMYAPAKSAAIPPQIPSPQHFQGAPTVPTIPPQVPTVAGFLRACDDLTSFVVSLRFRLMSLVAAANIQSQMYGPFVKSAAVAAKASAILEAAHHQRLHSTTSTSPLCEILTGPESGKGKVGGIMSSLHNNSGGPNKAHGGCVGAQLTAEPSLRRVAAVASALHEATATVDGPDTFGGGGGVDLEYADEVLFYAWDLLYPIGAPLLESLAASTYEVRCWATDLELSAQRMQCIKPKALAGDARLLAALPYATRATSLYEDNYEGIVSHIVGKAMGEGSSSGGDSNKKKKGSVVASSPSLTRLQAAVREFGEVFMGEGSECTVNAATIAHASVGTRVSLVGQDTMAALPHNPSAAAGARRDPSSPAYSYDILNNTASGSVFGGGTPVTNASVASYPLFANVRDRKGPSAEGKGPSEVRPSAPAPSLSRSLAVLHELRAAVTEACLEQSQKLLKKCRAMRSRGGGGGAEEGAKKKKNTKATTSDGSGADGQSSPTQDAAAAAVGDQSITSRSTASDSTADPPSSLLGQQRRAQQHQPAAANPEEVALTQQLLLERQFSEGLLHGALSVVLLTMLKSGTVPHENAHAMPLRASVEGCRGRVRRMLGKLLVMDQITRKGISPSTQGGGRMMPHMVRVGLRLSANNSSSSSSQHQLMGRVEYDEHCEFGVVASFMEALELCRGRPEVLANACVPIPHVANKAHPRALNAIQSDIVDRALRHFSSLVPRDDGGNGHNAPYPTTLNRTPNPLTRVTEFAANASPFFVSRAEDTRPLTTTANLATTIPTATSTPQLLAWRLFDWIATGTVSVGNVKKKKTQQKQQQEGAAEPDADGPNPPPPQRTIVPPTVASPAAAAGHVEQPLNFLDSNKNKKSKKFVGNAHPPPPPIPIPLNIAVPTAHTQQAPCDFASGGGATGGIIGSGAQVADPTLWLAACATNALIVAHRHNGPPTAHNNKYMCSAHHEEGPVRVASSHAQQTPSSSSPASFDEMLAILDTSGGSIGIVLSGDDAQHQRAIMAGCTRRYKSLASEGFALRASEMLLKPHLATEVTVESITTAAQKMHAAAADKARVQPATHVALPSYAVAPRDIAIAGDAAVNSTPVASPSSVSAAQLHAACRVLGTLGGMAIALDGKSARLSKLKTKRLTLMTEADAAEAIAAASTPTPTPVPEGSLPASAAPSRDVSPRPTRPPVKSKTTAAFMASSSSDDDLPPSGSSHRGDGNANPMLRRMGSRMMGGGGGLGPRGSMGHRGSSSSSDSSDGGLPHSNGSRLSSIAGGRNGNVSFASGSMSAHAMGGGGGSNKYHVMSATFEETHRSGANEGAPSMARGVGGGGGVLSNFTQKALETELLAAIQRENNARLCSL